MRSKAGAWLLLLLMPGVAWASNFGCAAEWLDVAVIVFAAPVSLGLCVLAWRATLETTFYWTLGLALLTASTVLATPCSYDDDPDGKALLAVALACAPPLALGARRGRSADE